MNNHVVLRLAGLELDADEGKNVKTERERAASEKVRPDAPEDLVSNPWDQDGVVSHGGACPPTR